MQGVLRNTVVSQGLRGDLSPKTAKRLATAQGDAVQGVPPPSRTGLIPASTLRNWSHRACSGGAVPTRVGLTARALARPWLTPGWGGVLALPSRGGGVEGPHSHSGSGSREPKDRQNPLRERTAVRRRRSILSHCGSLRQSAPFVCQSPQVLRTEQKHSFVS